MDEVINVQEKLYKISPDTSRIRRLADLWTFKTTLLGTALQAGRSRVRFPTVSLNFFIDNPSGRTMALGLTQPLTEMSTRSVSWG